MRPGRATGNPPKPVTRMGETTHSRMGGTGDGTSDGADRLQLDEAVRRCGDGDVPDCPVIQVLGGV